MPYFGGEQDKKLISVIRIKQYKVQNYFNMDYSQAEIAGYFIVSGFVIIFFYWIIVSGGAKKDSDVRRPRWSLVMEYLVVSLPFFGLVWTFYYAYSKNIIWQTEFLAGTVVSFLLILIFVANEKIPTDSDIEYHYSNELVMWGYMLLALLMRVFFAGDRRITEFFLPTFAISYSTYILKIMYMDRVYIFSRVPKKPQEVQQIKLEAEKNGDDGPWLGDIRYIEENPTEKTFVRGFNKDMKTLSEVIEKVSGKHSLLFYALYEPKNGVFDEIIRFSQEEGLYHQIMASKQGESLAIECKDERTLKILLESFWVGEYICWIVAHDRNFTNMAETMHRILNPYSFPDGFSELINDSYCFFRDVEKGKALLVISDKVSREEIQETILKKA